MDDWKSIVDTFLADAQKPLIVVLGPTASGKTMFSLELCAYLKHAEVINADSRQFYKGLDIGTAKISKEEMGDIPHHLFSVLKPDQPVTIKWYQDEVHRVIDSIHARQHIPVLVGGSMLYISAIIDGLDPQTAGDEKLRATLSDLYDKDEGETLHAQLRDIDPASADVIPQKNKQYLIRAMEIYILTGMPKSAQQAQQDCPYNVLILGINQERDVLYERINARVDAMFADGWVEEVRALAMKGYGSDAPAMESHGYHEILQWLETGEDPDALESLKEGIAKRSRHYAKRQMTWWRNDPRIVWL